MHYKLNYALSARQHRIVVAALKNYTYGIRQRQQVQQVPKEYSDELCRLIDIFEVKGDFDVIIDVKGEDN